MTDGKLLSGGSLYPEQTLISPGGHGHLHLQGDGNCVSYLDGFPVWASHTDGQTAGRLTMQTNGELVLFDREGNPLYSTKTNGHAGAMVQIQDDAVFVIYEDPNGPKAGTPIWASIDGEFSPGANEPDAAILTCPNPIYGIVRSGNLFSLNGRPTTPKMSSEFPMLRIRRDDRPMYHQLLDDMVRYGKQGSRQFTAVGGWGEKPPKVGFWTGSEVVPPLHGFTQWVWGGNVTRPADVNGVPQYGQALQRWDDWDENFVGHLEDFLRRGLTIDVTLGDAQIIFSDIVNGQPRYNYDKEMAHHQHVCSLIRQVDPKVIAFYQMRNEIPMNSPEGGSAKDVADCRKFKDEVKRLLPGVMVGLGAYLSEEPADLNMMGEGCDMVFVHGLRDPFPSCLKHALGIRYFEGNWGSFKWPVGQFEPKPMDIPPFNDGIGDDSYLPTERIDQLIALHLMFAITSQGGNLFTGASVKLKTYPSLMPGYKEIPQIIADHVPDDVNTWSRETAGHGAILYFTNGKRLLTSTDETWDTTPPHPVASWKMYTGRGINMEVLQGTGNPPQKRTGFIVGTFA